MTNDGLSWSNLIAAWDVICPRLYYATLEYCERDKIIHVKKGKFHPEYIVFHPDDLTKVKANITGRQLISIREYPIPGESDEFMKNIAADLEKKLGRITR